MIANNFEVITGLAKHKDVIPFIKTLSCPVIHIGDPFDSDIPAICISEDNRTIARLAFEHFESLFFRNYATFTRFIANPRNDYFKEMVEESGKKCSIVKIDSNFADTTTYFTKLGRRLRELSYPIAIFTPDDEDAKIVVEVCMDIGLRVPEDIAVIGVHNNELVCETSPVPISSVDIAHEKLGYEAADLLNRLMNNEELEERHIVLYPERVVARQSTNLLAVAHSEVAKALEFIHDNYMHNIYVDDIVKVTTLTKIGLYKAFKTHIGRTPGKHLTHVRLQKALELLQNPEAKVYEVADQTGFFAYNLLYLAMKKSYDITPKQYQKKFIKKK